MRQHILRRFGRRLAVGCVLGTVAVAATACGGDSSKTGGSGGANNEKIDIAVIYSSPLDSGYGRAHINALRAAIRDLGAEHFTLKTVDNVPFTAQLTQTTQQLFQGGADLVVDMATAGELFFRACEQVPDKHCLEGYPVGKMPSNTAGYWVDTNSLFYAQGVAAGLLTRHGETGFVNAIKLPAMTAIVNSFALGCRSVRPDCTVRNIYLDSFTDPPKEVEATNTLANQGVDVIGHFMDDPATLKSSAARGIWSFGLYEDQRSVTPDHYVTSQIWQPALERIFKAQLQLLLDGRWNAGEIAWGSPDGTVDMPFGDWGPDVPAKVRRHVQAVYDELNSGMNPFRGPLEDARGKVRLAAGEESDPRDPAGLVYSNWTWPVQGVIGG